MINGAFKCSQQQMVSVHTTAASMSIPLKMNSQHAGRTKLATVECYLPTFNITRAIFPNLESPRHGGEENREARSVYEDVCRGRPSSAAHRGEMPRRHDQSCGVHRAQDCESTESDICGHVHNRLTPYGDIIYSSWHAVHAPPLGISKFSFCCFGGIFHLI